MTSWSLSVSSSMVTSEIGAGQPSVSISQQACMSGTAFLCAREEPLFRRTARAVQKPHVRFCCKCIILVRGNLERHACAVQGLTLPLSSQRTRGSGSSSTPWPAMWCQTAAGLRWPPCQRRGATLSSPSSSTCAHLRMHTTGDDVVSSSSLTAQLQEPKQGVAACMMLSKSETCQQLCAGYL